jgi:peroxiredoxin
MSSRARSGLAALLVAALAGLAIAVVSTAGGTGTGTATAAGRAPGFTASSTTGRFELAADRGHPTVLAFVQAGCGPCIGEMRNYAQLAPRTPGVRFVALNLPGGGSARDLANFGASFGATRDVTYVADPGGKIAQLYGVTVADTVIVIDRAGRIRARLVGPSRSALRAALRALAT